jgi:hypothetical protein
MSDTRAAGQGDAEASTRERDVEAEEAILEEVLGSADERRARFELEVMAEAAAAIGSLGVDWGLEEFASQFDAPARDDLLKSASTNLEARRVLDGYVAFLQEHRAEFVAKLLNSPTAPPA